MTYHSIYHYLSERLLDDPSREGQKKIVLFWVDTILHNHEEKDFVYIDSQERKRIKDDMLNWFSYTFMNILQKYKITEDRESARRKLFNAIYSRTRFLARGLQRERMKKEKEKEKKEKEKQEEERKKKHTGSSYEYKTTALSELEERQQEEVLSTLHTETDFHVLQRELMEQFNVNSLDDLAYMIQEGQNDEVSLLVKEYLNMLETAIG